MLNQVDGVLPNSWLELKAIQADLNWKGKIYEIAPYGDAKMFLNANGEEFRRYTGIDEEFIMQAEGLNQEKSGNVVLGIKKYRNKTVLIGGTKHWPIMQNFASKYMESHW